MQLQKSQQRIYHQCQPRKLAIEILQACRGLTRSLFQRVSTIQAGDCRGLINPFPQFSRPQSTPFGLSVFLFHAGVFVSAKLLATRSNVQHRPSAALRA